jgi:hypothetical protein
VVNCKLSVYLCCSIRIIYFNGRAKYPLAITNKLINTLGPKQLQGYDIGCHFTKTASRGLLTGPRVQAAMHAFCCGSFHGHAHNRLCQIDWLPLYYEGAGLESFEGCERFFYESNALGGRTRHMSIYHRQMAIVQHLQRWDHDRYLNLGMSPILFRHQPALIYHPAKTLWHSFKNACNTLHSLSLELSALQSVYKIGSDAIFHQWLHAEKDYLLNCAIEPPENILKVEYVQSLQKLHTST